MLDSRLVLGWVVLLNRITRPFRLADELLSLKSLR